MVVYRRRGKVCYPSSRKGASPNGAGDREIYACVFLRECFGLNQRLQMSAIFYE